MLIEIISIGDEILAGNILDTNKQFLSDACWQQGFKVEYHTGVRDDDEAIRDALIRAADRADAVICTGGLGPTADDFTMEMAAKAFGVDLEVDKGTLDYLTKLYQRKGRILSDNNRKQAMIPKGGRALPNSYGTAPGVAYTFKGKYFYFLPGVPREMKYVFITYILPELIKNRKDGIHFKTKFLKTFGCPESELDNKLSDMMHGRSLIENARIGFRPHFPEIYIKVSVWDKKENKAQKDLEGVVQKIYSRIGQYIYSESESQTLELLVVEKLMQAHKTLALAESCTGGLVADRITNISGASDIFLGGVVSYSNDMKKNILGVDETILKKHGAVSEECAEAMVRGIQKNTGADYCVAITGIAGPTGGSPEKPVGTVYISTLFDGVLENKKYNLPFPREMFKELVSSVVLKRIFDALK